MTGVTLSKKQAISDIVAATDKVPTVFTTGFTARYGRWLKPHLAFCMVGSMGLATSIAYGIANATKAAVLVLDGDGSLAMNPGNLMLADSFPSAGVVHVVLDDGTYSSTGGQSVPRLGDFGSWAKSLGYIQVPWDPAIPLSDTMRQAVAAAASGPQLVHLQVDGSSDHLEVSPRVEESLAEHARSFIEELRGNHG